MRPQFVWALLCTSLQLVRQIRRFNLNVSQFTFFFPHVRIFPFNFGWIFQAMTTFPTHFRLTLTPSNLPGLQVFATPVGWFSSKCPSEKVHRQTSAAGGSDCEQHFGNKDSYFQYLQYELLGVLTYRPLVVLNAASIASFFIIAAHQLLRAASLFHVMNKNNHDVQVHLLQTQEGIYTVLDTCTIYWTTIVSLL